LLDAIEAATGLGPVTQILILALVLAVIATAVQLARRSR